MGGSVVLWDFDGTLAARAGKWRDCLVDALTSVVPGHAVTRDDLAPGLRGGLPWHRPDVGHAERDTPEAWWGALEPLFTAAYVRVGVEEGPAGRAARAVRAHYTDLARWALYPDTVAVLEELAAAGWRHVVVSNHVPELGSLIRDLGIEDHFAAVVNSALLGWEKPNPRIFAAALERAGHPARVWMVGDNPTADIAGARAAGIPGILVDHDRDGLRPVARRILDETAAAAPVS